MPLGFGGSSPLFAASRPVEPALVCCPSKKFGRHQICQFYTRLNRPFKGRGWWRDLDVLGAVSKTGIKSFLGKFFRRLSQGSVTVCGCGCQAGKVGARDRQKMAYYCPRRGPWGRARQVSDVAVKVTIGASGWHATLPYYYSPLKIAALCCSSSSSFRRFGFACFLRDISMPQVSSLEIHTILSIKIMLQGHNHNAPRPLLLTAGDCGISESMRGGGMTSRPEPGGHYR